MSDQTAPRARSASVANPRRTRLPGAPVPPDTSRTERPGERRD